MRIGIFGGTFDPPHLGHTTIATVARDQLSLDVVEMIPSYTPPHRSDVHADPFDRFAMVVLACLEIPGVVPSSRELRRGGVSYTVDTLREIAMEKPPSELFLILGGDSYDQLPGWKDADEITARAHLAVVARQGSDGLDRARDTDRARLATPGREPGGGGTLVHRVDCPPLHVSAREIRQRIAGGEARIDDLAPGVSRYIEKVGLYRERSRVS